MRIAAETWAAKPRGTLMPLSRSRSPSKLDGMHLHPHSHAHANTGKVLRIALIFTAIYIGLLVVAGIRAHSLALLSEAGHNVSDFVALLLSWFAVYLEERPPSATKTFGYRRAGVIAAFINASSLVFIAILIFYAAVQRFYRP